MFTAVSVEDFQHAKRAKEELDRMISSEFRPLLRTITRNPKLEVASHGGAPATNGLTVWLQIPWKLGETLEHNTVLCRQVDEHMLSLCPACRVRDEVRADMWHESAHITEDTFADIDRYDLWQLFHDKFDMSNLSQDQLWEKKQTVIQSKEAWKTVGVADPWLGITWNVVEDIYVNRRLYQARPGTEPGMQATLRQSFFQTKPPTSSLSPEKREQVRNFSALMVPLLMGHHVTDDDVKATFGAEHLPLFDDQVIRDLVDAIPADCTPFERIDMATDLLLRLRELGFLPRPQDSMIPPPPPSPQGSDEDEQEGGESDEEQEQEAESDETGGGAQDQDDESEDEGDDTEESDEDEGGTGESEGDESDDDEGDQDGEGDSDDEDDESYDDDDAQAGSGDESEEDEESDDESEGEGGDDPDDEESDDEAEGEGESEDEESDDESEAEGEGEADDEESDEESDDESEGEGDDGDGEGESEDQLSDDDIQAMVDAIASQIEESMGHDEETRDANNEEAIRAALEQINFDEPSAYLSGHQEVSAEDFLNVYGVNAKGNPVSIDEGLIARPLSHLRVVFAENKRTNLRGDLRRGPRLDARHLHRAGSKDYRIFGRKDIPKRRDWSILVGVDFTSSNDSNGALTPVKSVTMAMGEILSRLGVDFRMEAHASGYDSDRSSLFLATTTIKSFDEPWCSETRRRLNLMRGIGSNLDGHTMEFYRKIMEARRATDKVIIYFTDGELHGSGEEGEVLTRNIELCKRLGIQLVCVSYRNGKPAQMGFETIRFDGAHDLHAITNGLDKLLSR